MKMYKNSFTKSVDKPAPVCYNVIKIRDKKGVDKMFLNLMFGAIILRMAYMAVKF